jgi:hypothetical protein
MLGPVISAVPNAFLLLPAARSGYVIAADDQDD